MLHDCESSCFNCNRQEVLLSACQVMKLLPVYFNQAKLVLNEHDVLFRQMADAKEIYYLVGGRVILVNASTSGKTTSFGIKKAGDFIGIAPVLNGSHYPCSAFAIEPVTAHKINRENFNRLLSMNPELKLKLMSYLIKDIDSAYNRVPPSSPLPA